MIRMHMAGMKGKWALVVALCILPVLSAWAASASGREPQGVSQNGSRVFLPTIIGPPRAIVQSKVMRVSVATDGTQGSTHSTNPAISADGRYIAFESRAPNLAPGDSDQDWDVFLHDRLTGLTTRLSTALPGYPGASQNPAISADGRFVAFDSWGGLIPGDTDFYFDVYLYDQLTGELSIITDPAYGMPTAGAGPSLSGDGRYVVFGPSGVWIHDRQTRQTTEVPKSPDGMPPNASSRGGKITENGRVVAFESLATNLAPGDPNTDFDIYVRDYQTGQISLLPLLGPEGQGQTNFLAPSPSADGRYIAFMSYYTRHVPNDTNGLRDVFVHDRHTGQTQRVSVASDGTEANGHSEWPSISGDGRYVAFESGARNLDSLSELSERFDIFVHDRWTGETRRVSVTAGGTLGNGFSQQPAISSNGRYVAYSSSSSNLVPGDTNGVSDIFVYDRLGP